MKKIIFIGGGITSCVVAMFLAKKGHSVEIYEKKDYLGGILKDFNTESGIFLRGCKYFNVENNWFKFFFGGLSADLISFTQSYGVLVENCGKFFISDKYAVPLFPDIDLKKLILNSKNVDFKNIRTVSERFTFYPKKIKNFLKKIILKYKVNPDKLYHTSVAGFQISRIASQTKQKEIYHLKKKNSVFNEILALDRASLLKKMPIAALPKNGYDSLFKNIRTQLLNYKVKIETKSLIHPEWHNKKLKLYNKNLEIGNDLVIWTGDPTKLVSTFNKKILDSTYLKMIQFNSNIIKSKNFKIIYIQVFSDNSNITRISLYKVNNIEKISIETIFDNVKDHNYVYEEALKILKKFNILLFLDNSTFTKNLDVRFNVISDKDEIILNEFNISTKNTNLLNSSLLDYGIDNKIDFLLKKLRKKKYL